MRSNKQMYDAVQLFIKELGRTKLEEEMKVAELLGEEFPQVRNSDPDRLVTTAKRICEVFDGK
jgi:hypothetical protein